MTRSDLLVEAPDRWIIDVSGAEVTRCCVDFAFQLLLVGNNMEMTVKIEGPFTIQSDKGISGFNPGAGNSVSLGPALSLFRRAASSAVVWKNGSLALEFSDGSRLCVDPLADYEAWQITGPGALLLVCTPGGEIAVWT